MKSIEELKRIKARVSGEIALREKKKPPRQAAVDVKKS